MCEWTGWSVPSRRDGGVCGLSDVLEPMSPRLRRYFLSPTALKGILRRADARGKALPTLLRDAIEWMLGWWETQPKEEQGGGIDAIALDGDKLKPREDQRKGGNGFGINEEGAGYTLTGVDRHGVAYCADGGDVASTITRQISERSGQDNRANAVVQCYDMTHADDPGRKVEGGISPTLQSRMGTGGNQVPLCVMAYRPPIQDLIAEACAKYGANWPEDEWAEITEEVMLNIYIDMDGKRRATAFQKSDANLEFGVDISYVGDGVSQSLIGGTAPGHKNAVISTNSNGEDVAATLTRDLAKQTGAQQQNGGGTC